jgi:flagellar hook-associated protein 3 FlgL
MRISFNQKYQVNLNSILSAQDRLQNASAKLDKQTKILTPSDDPSASARVVGLDQQISQMDQFQRNSVILRNSLDLEEAALSNIRGTMDQARVLAVQLGNGSFAQTERNAIATQMKNMRSQIFDLMNQKDSDGGYLFSGFQDEIQAYSFDAATGKYEYKGDEGQKKLQVSPSVSVASNDSGKIVFEDVNARRKTTTPIVAGGITAAAFEITNQSTYDDYYRQNYDGLIPANNNFSVVIDAANNYEIQRNGASLSPAVTGTYVVGGDINFKGIKMSLNGAGPGQVDFSFKNPEKSNILNTLTDLINAIEVNQVSGTALKESMADALAQIDGAAVKIDAAMSGLGGRQNLVDTIESGNDDLQISNKSFRADLYEIDYAEAITELTKQETALSAVQQTFNRVTSTSLFDYLR